MQRVLSNIIHILFQTDLQRRLRVNISSFVLSIEPCLRHQVYPSFFPYSLVLKPIAVGPAAVVLVVALTVKTTAQPATLRAAAAVPALVVTAVGPAIAVPEDALTAKTTGQRDIVNAATVALLVAGVPLQQRDIGIAVVADAERE